MLQYLIIFLVSMVPIIELRGAMVYAVGYGLPYIPALIVCVLGNMIPVPFIYFFARKFLTWGANQKHIGKICSFFLVKGEKAGQKLVETAGRGGLFVALMLFVGIPLPGTGAWTGTLGASFLNMGFKSTVASVCLGVVMAGIIMAALSTGVFSLIGL
ncbi:MAG: small multi-drug export protein [Oscillospiraceae bacterium]|nr:small multi-drug export protein [Oscillospiraceae bacterium]